MPHDHSPLRRLEPRSHRPNLRAQRGPNPHRLAGFAGYVDSNGFFGPRLALRRSDPEARQLPANRAA